MTEATVVTLAANKVLRFLQPNDSYMNDGEIAVRIERDSDGLVYDASNPDPAARIFKADASCVNPFILLVKGAGNNRGRLEASVALDANFVDGEYVINFHDMRYPARNVFSMDMVRVWNGSAAAVKPFTDLELCYRIMRITVSAHKLPGTVGAWMNDLMTKVNSIEAKVNAIQTKVGA